MQKILPAADSGEAVRGNALAELRRIAGFAGGTVGIAARHLSTGATLALAADQRFPMASTVKMALALAVLDRIRRGEMGLAEMVAVQPAEMDPDGAMGREFPHDGVALSVANLLELTITRSDNTATDVLFRLVGGPAGVAAYLACAGLDGIEVTRTMRAALCVMYGIAEPAAGVSMRDVVLGLDENQIAARSRPSGTAEDYGHDRRDHATPLAMLDLLTRLWRADGVDAAARDLVLAMMARTSTGATRIRARLPGGVAVANKTGSGLGTANDLGFVTLPDGRGTVALVVYVMGSPLPLAAREGALADIARLVYDYFLLTTCPA